MFNDDIKNRQILQLKQLFPEVFTEDKVDWVRLKVTLGEAVDLDERYGLSWKGKSDVFSTIQEKTAQTLHPDLANSLDADNTQNMFIEGDNLAALKILHKAYYGKVKMIYIDPPYNTGNDFVYNDDFKQTRRSYEAEAGITDEEGNITRDDGLRANTGGHKHSNWLNMMYPRLFLARNLLRQDGVIFVSIDDNEVHNLRLMMNEIFGEENFVAQISIKSNPRGSQSSNYIAKVHEYLLVYVRNENEFRMGNLSLDDDTIREYKNIDGDGRRYRLLGLRQRGGAWRREQRPKMFFPLFVNPEDGSVSLSQDGEHTIEVLPRRPDGEDSRWSWGKEKSLEYTFQLVGRPVNGGEKYDIFRKDYLENLEGGVRGVKPKSIWEGKEFNYQWGRIEIKDLFGNSEIFDYPKPTSLIRTALEFTTSDDDIILDFFSGSGTTAHAVAELNAEDGGNRKWICVQLPELTDEKSEAFKAGYLTIADIARERIRRASAKIHTDFADKLADRESPIDLGFRAYRVGNSNFKQWNELVADADEIRQQALDAIDPLEPGATDDDLLVELLLKRGISPLTPIEQHEKFLSIPSEQLAISLVANLSESDLDRILATKPQQILLLDRAFADNTTLRANFLLRADREGVKVEVV